MNRYQFKICSAALLPSVATRTLSANGYSGDTRSEVRDSAGAVLSQTCVVDVGTRFS